MNFAVVISGLDLDLIELRGNLRGIEQCFQKGDAEAIRARIEEHRAAIRILTSAQVDLRGELAALMGLPADATDAQVLANAKDAARVLQFQGEEISRLTELLQP